MERDVFNKRNPISVSRTLLHVIRLRWRTFVLWGILLDLAVMLTLLSMIAAKAAGWHAPLIVGATWWLFVCGVFVSGCGMLRVGWQMTTQHIQHFHHLTGYCNAPSRRLAKAAQKLIPQGRLYLLRDPTPFAACIGLWRPAVYVSTGLVAQLSLPALRAALAHEEAHRRRRDPLRIVLLRIITQDLVPLTWLMQVTDRVALRAEIAADSFARRHVSTPALATALLQVIRANPQNDAFPPALSGQLNSVDAALLDGPIGGEQRSFFNERLRYLDMAPDKPLPTLLPTLPPPHHLARVCLVLGMSLSVMATWVTLTLVGVFLLSPTFFLTIKCATHF